MHQNAFGGWAPPRPDGELMPSPDSQDAIRGPIGPTSKREGREETDGDGERRVRKEWGVHQFDLLIDGLTV